MSLRRRDWKKVVVAGETKLVAMYATLMCPKPVGLHV